MATTKPTTSSAIRPAASFSCVYIPAFALQAAIEHIRDIRVTACPQLERARLVRYRVVSLSGKRCHGLKFLARIRAKLGSRSCVLSSHPFQKGEGDGRVADEGFNKDAIGQAMIQTDAPPGGSRQQRDSDRPAPGAGSHAPGLGPGLRFNALIDPADRRAQYVCLRSVVS